MAKCQQETAAVPAFLRAAPRDVGPGQRMALRVSAEAVKWAEYEGLATVPVYAQHIRTCGAAGEASFTYSRLSIGVGRTTRNQADMARGAIAVLPSCSNEGLFGQNVSNFKNLAM